MNILEFDQQEFEEALEIGRSNLEESGETMEEYMDMSFKSLIFLGRNVKEKPELFDVAVFNIRLCYTYYKEREDYLKLAQITSLVKDLEKESKKIVDEFIINEISVNLN